MASRGTGGAGGPGGPRRTAARSGGPSGSGGSRSGPSRTPRAAGPGRPRERAHTGRAGAQSSSIPAGKVGRAGNLDNAGRAAKAGKATPVRPPRSPRSVNRTRRLAVLATVVGLLAVFVTPTVHAYLGQRSQIHQLREQVAGQQRDVASLQKQQQLWADDQYVIQQARQRLKFVKVGEKSYTVIDGDVSKDDIGLASAPASSDDHPWYGRLWESVGVADAPAAHP